jgi:hypothetical protein
MALHTSDELVLALEDSFSAVVATAFPLLDGRYISRSSAEAHEAELADTGAQRAAALLAVSRACKAVRVNSIFSANDDTDDLNTDCIRFVMLEFWRGQLLEKEVNVSSRLAALNGARAAYLAFLQQLQRIGLLLREEASLVGDDLIDEDDAVRQDQAQQRMYKVGRVKRRRALANSLLEFHWSSTYLSAASGEDGIGSAEGIAGGESTQRMRALDALQVAAMDAVDSLKFISQELPMLKMVAAERSVASSGAGSAADGDSRVSDGEARRQREREASRDAAFAPDRPGLVSTLPCYHRVPPSAHFNAGCDALCP